MRLLHLLLIFLLSTTVPLVHAADQEAQAEILLAKISAALLEGRSGVALSYCATLEKLGPSLRRPLPESFYFYQIEALKQSGVKGKALIRGRSYLEKFGKKAPHAMQVAAIVRILEEEALSAGQGGDADAAAGAWAVEFRLQKEAEQAQTLQLLRNCQSEAIALEVTEKALYADIEGVNTLGASLHAQKASLDQRAAQINGSLQRSLQEERQMRLDYNRESQAYNDAVNDFNTARERYMTKVEDQNLLRQGYEERCTNLSVLAYDFETVCGGSDDWFCRNRE